MDEFFNEALRFIHETVDIRELKRDFPIVEFDEEFLRKVMKARSRERAFYDLLFAVRHYVNTHRSPITDDLVEQVESIVKRWKSRREEIKRLYQELFEIAERIEKRTRERRELELSELEYALVMVLKKHVKADTRELIDDVKALLHETEALRFPRWQEKAEVVSELSRVVMKFLIRKYRGRYDDLMNTREDVLEVLKRWG